MKACRTSLIAGWLALLASVIASIAPALAQSEADRLREALRSATVQTRSLEDQRTAMQAQIAEITRARDELKAEVVAANAKAKKAEADYRAAVREFNDRLEERNQALEKWKEAYTEAANVARTKDAERAKFEGLSKAYQASTRSCTLKNKELVIAGRELLQHYEGVTFGDQILAQEPWIGIRRVQIQNLLQDYGDKILNQKVEP